MSASPEAPANRFQNAAHPMQAELRPLSGTRSLLAAGRDVSQPWLDRDCQEAGGPVPDLVELAMQAARASAHALHIAGLRPARDSAPAHAPATPAHGHLQAAGQCCGAAVAQQ